MDEQREVTKAELLKAIEQSWSELIGALNRLTEAQATGIRDEEGWVVKDHVTHMAAWERSVVFLLQGKPRHEGLGVDEALYLEDDDDKTNAAISAQHKNLPLADALAHLRDVHGQLINLLQPLSDADLLKPYSRYLPNEPREGNDPPVFGLIYGNTAGHFNEHLGWIKTLVRDA